MFDHYVVLGGTPQYNYPMIVDTDKQQIIWQEADTKIVANIAFDVENGYAYALDSNGIMSQIVLDSGDVRQTFQFPIPDNEGSPWAGFYLAAYDNWLATYYDNTDELSVYRIAD